MRMKQEVRFSLAVKAQTLGAGLQAHRLEKLNRYERTLTASLSESLPSF